MYTPEVLKTLNKLMSKVKPVKYGQIKHTNTWHHKGNIYFIEPGKYHADGAMTGYIVKSISIGLNKEVGSFRINADGTIKRFPCIPKKIRESI